MRTAPISVTCRPARGARGLEVEGDERHVGQVGVGISQWREGEKVAGRAGAEPLILLHERRGLRQKPARARGGGERSRGGLHRVERLSAHQEGLVELSATRSESCNCMAAG